MVTGPSVNNPMAISGKAVFFDPLTCKSPVNGLPPLITSLSMHSQEKNLIESSLAKGRKGSGFALQRLVERTTKSEYSNILSFIKSNLHGD